MLPKHLEPRLVTLRDPKVHRVRAAERSTQLAAQIKDNNYRVFAEGGQLHLVGADLHLTDRDPFLLFERLLNPGFGGAADTHQPPANVDPSHAFYLGYEMAKAATALTLGKEYRQDEALDWGYLTQAEESHRLAKIVGRSKRRRSGADDARPANRTCRWRSNCIRRPMSKRLCRGWPRCRIACSSTAPCAIRGWAAIRF